MTRGQAGLETIAKRQKSGNLVGNFQPQNPGKIQYCVPLQTFYSAVTHVLLQYSTLRNPLRNFYTDFS